MLKHTELQSETQGVKDFGAQSGATAAKTSSSEIEVKALIVFFRTRYKSFVGLIFAPIFDETGSLLIHLVLMKKP